MAKFDVTIINAEGGTVGETQTVSNRKQQFELGDQLIEVVPRTSTLRVFDAEGNIIKEHAIKQLPDTRVFHTSLIKHAFNIPPKVVVTRTE